MFVFLSEKGHMKGAGQIRKGNVVTDKRPSQVVCIHLCLRGPKMFRKCGHFAKKSCVLKWKLFSVYEPSTTHYNTNYGPIMGRQAHQYFILSSKKTTYFACRMFYKYMTQRLARPRCPNVNTPVRSWQFNYECQAGCKNSQFNSFPNLISTSLNSNHCLCLNLIKT